MRDEALLECMFGCIENLPPGHRLGAKRERCGSAVWATSFCCNAGDTPASTDCFLLNRIRSSRIARGAEAGALPEFWQWNRCEPKDRHWPCQWLNRRRDRGRQLFSACGLSLLPARARHFSIYRKSVV